MHKVYIAVLTVSQQDDTLMSHRERIPHYTLKAKYDHRGQMGSKYKTQEVLCVQLCKSDNDNENNQLVIFHTQERVVEDH